MARFDEALPLERAFETLLEQTRQGLALLTTLKNNVQTYERKLIAEGLHKTSN